MMHEPSSRMNFVVLLMPKSKSKSNIIFLLTTNTIISLLLHTAAAASQAQSPGIEEVRIVHHQHLNNRILVPLIASSSLLAGIIFLFLVLYLFFRRRHQNLTTPASTSSSKTQEAAKGGKEETLTSINAAKLNYSRMADKKSSVAIFNFQLLEAATNNFSTTNIMGESTGTGTGTGNSRLVYRARFDQHFQAAVKKADSDADTEFQNEVSLLSKIRHHNIIKLLGYCIHGASRFLVYEFMENGSLETQLHGPNRGSSMTWYIRLRIAIDVARALEYLHEHSNPPVVHRDLKSSNVLLDSNFNAKLSDFGLAIATGVQQKNMKLKMSGTLGYVAPEYISHGKLTDKSDVYGFGVVLLELLTGRKPMENMSSDDQYESLVSWAMPQLTDRSKLPSILDPVIRETMDLKHLYQVAAVAVLCVQAEPSYRPLITDVLHSLIPLVPVELGGSLRVTEPICLENFQ